MKLQLSPRPEQKLAITAGLQQALQVLQMPILELSEWLKIQIEQNPLLEYQEVRGSAPVSEECQEIDFDKKSFSILDDLDETFTRCAFPEENFEKAEIGPAYKASLFDHLMIQASEMFSSKDDLQKAEKIIGSLDKQGFLGDSGADEKVLAIIQTFDPPGIAARGLRDSLLIQLRLQEKENSPLYVAVRDRFDNLVREKKFHRELAALDFCPARRFQTLVSPPMVPDVTIEKIADAWQIEINEKPLPLFHLSSIHSSDKADQAYIRRHLAQGKWLLRILRRRRQTLKSIVLFLLKKQADFFNGQPHKLHPLTFQEVAKDLGLHESTIARAIGHKVISCPHGLFALRIFFSSGLATTSGEKISNRTAKTLIAELIGREDKSSPLSDDAIACHLTKQGITIARRTVAKYRQGLRIPPASNRKN